MARLGVKNYRFSLSWPRILPQGVGAVNEEGVAFYNRLIDALLANGIRPFVTLFHWDYPQALADRGAWANPDSPKWFEAYVSVCARRFGDRVKALITPRRAAVLHWSGLWHGRSRAGTDAPRRRDHPDEPSCAQGARSGGSRPAFDSLRIAAWAMRRAATRPFRSPLLLLMWKPRVKRISTCRPAISGRLTSPGGATRRCWAIIRNPAWHSFGALPQGWEQGDLALISQPLDLYAQNIYNGRPFRAADNAKGYEEVPGAIGEPRTAIGWTIRPDALYWGPKFLYERYQTPFIISENGMSAHDAVSLDGHVHDPNREDYMRRYLLAYRRAAEDGVDAAGYFAWSLMDNYEWAYGYSERFGLIHVDYATQKRTPKDSAFWYQTVMESNGENL